MKTELDTMTNALAAAAKVTDTIRAKLYAKIQSLPDNPNIKRGTGYIKCFSMSSAEIFSNPQNPHLRMDVFFHDFKAQYKEIVELIEKAQANNVIPILEKIIRTGRIESKQRSTTLHPTVIHHLQALTGINGN